MVAVGVPDFFFACGWIGLLIFLRNEKKQYAKLCDDCKKCDREKPTKGGCAEVGIKTVQAPKYKGRGFISGWWKKPTELPVIEFQA